MPNSHNYLPDCDFDVPAEADQVAPQKQPKTLKGRLDTDKVFKKKLTRMATSAELEVVEMSPKEDIKGREVTAPDKDLDEIVTQENVPPPPKKKRNMSEKQLEALARGRATSLAKRQANKKAKQPVSEPQVNSPIAPEPEEESPVPKSVTINDLPQEILRDRRTAVKQVKSPTHPRNKTDKPNPDTGMPYKIAREHPLNRDDIKSMMTDAIGQYDTLRKERKAEKKEQQRKVVHDQRISQQLNRVMNPSEPDYFNECFTFS